jgi:neuronal guanine nucleotide exchange factor
MFANSNHTYSMQNTNNHRNKQHVSPNKTKTQQQQQQQPSSTLLQRLNPFSKETNADGKTKNCSESKPADVKLQPSSKKSNADEYQGVKNLKQYWDKKISHTKLLELDKRPKTVKSATLDYKPSKLSTSEANKTSNSLNRKTCAKTVPLESNNKKEVPDNSKKFKNEPSALPVLRLDLKNSYKYKSNDSVSKRLNCELSPLTENLNVIKRFRPESVNLPINRHSVSTLHFPAISTTESGGKIHWAKREEIFGKRAIKKETHTDKAELIAPYTNNNTKMSIKDNENQVNQTEMAQNILSQDDKKPLPTANDECNKTDKSNNVTTNSLFSQDNSSFVATSNKLLCSTLSAGSVTSALESPSRKTARKFSFKTNSNAASSYHKKMSANGGSKVAALTQRFNQLIQLDASLLEEVKRRGIVVHKTGGNVYKIKEGVDPTVRRRSIKRSDDSTDDASSIGKPVKKKTSVRRKVSARVSHQRNSNSSIGSVKATIQLFEPKATNTSQAKVKPKVPDKSEQVLEKTKELKTKRSPTKTKLENPKPNKSLKSDLEIKIISFKSVKTATPTTSVLEKLDEIPEISEIIESPKDKCVEKPKISDEETKQSKEKSKYSKIYEKIRFRPSFFQSKKLDKVEVTPQPQMSKSVQNFEDIILTPQPVEINQFEEELHSVHDRIDSLSKSVCNLTTSKKQYEDVARNVKPNESFLFRTTSKSSFSSTYDFLYKTSVVEAVNSALINKTQSMDEGSFPHSQNFTKQISMNDSRTYVQMLEEADELIKKFSKKEDEHNTTDDGYELYSESPPGAAAEAINVDLINSIQMGKASESSASTVSETYPPLLQADEGIYQSLQEVTKTTVQNDTISIDSYESVERYEEVPDEGSAESLERENNLKTYEDQYEVCDPPKPPPRILETSSSPSSEQPPQLPSPKRLVTIKTVNSCTTYEKIHYEQLPSRPPKSPQFTEKQYVPLPPRNSFSENSLRVSVVTVNQEPRVISDEQEPDYYDENIYDTIKNGDNKSISSNCYESLNKVHKPHGDTISLISNCYESISLKNEYRPNHMLRHADSISTLSSDHKTNSLYGTTIGMVTTPPSERGSDASDDWIDVSDEESEPKQSFIV